MSRIDIIGANGGDGAHYDDPLYWRKRAENAEAELQRLREQDPVAKLVSSPTSHIVLDPESDVIDNYLAIGTKLYAAPVPPPDVRELVEALERLVLCEECADESEWTNAWDEARAALAKFRGQS
jgi:hypothetical protein